MTKIRNIAKLALHSSIISFSAVALIGANLVCSAFSGQITQALVGFGIKYDGEKVEETKKAGKALSEEITEQGIVMLKNENNVLPLKNTKVNVFGWGGSDAGYICQGDGSGSGSGAGRTHLMQSLTNSGIEYNPELKKAYDDLRYGRTPIDGVDRDLSLYFRLIEAPESFYTEERMQQAKEFSDTALIVLSRRGTEGGDLPKVQYGIDGSIMNANRKYSELTLLEEKMIEEVTNNFANVIVILNAANPMECGFINNEKIDAAFQVGFAGNYGTVALGRILKGEINPSGRLVDTFAYDLSTAATYENAGGDGATQFSNFNDYSSQINGTKFHYQDYTEDIYIGYQWYETADVMGFWGSDFAKDKWGVEKYEDVVQYPFGYGLSYTTFEWTIDPESMISTSSPFTGETKFTFDVYVKNTGNVAGREVVQLYYSVPYNEGGIEKSSIRLGAYAKTGLLNPGLSEKLTLSFNARDMASYDCYDRNNNEFMGYELEKGEYTLSFRKNVHEIKEDVIGGSKFKYELRDDVRYETDEVTGTKIENQFTTYENTQSGAKSKINEPEAEVAYSIDGNENNQNLTYLTRSNFAGTFPIRRDAIAMSQEMWEETWVAHEPFIDSNDVMPKTNSKETSWRIDDVLGLPYDDPMWIELIEQLSVSDIANLSAHGGFGTNAIAKINKPRANDFDGPSGFNGTITGTNTPATNYPSGSLIAQTWDWKVAYKFGQSVGDEADALGIDGWYAPGANMHRSPMGGRNFEYYSEDPLMSGIVCAYTVNGAKSRGLYAYIKHFAINDTERGRNGEYKYLTEQSLREIYLEPFEIAVKLGKSNAMMASVDRIGTTRVTGSYALLTQVLRNEWGFRGSVITDYYQGGNVNDCDEGIRAGNDLMLNPGGNAGTFDDTKSATSVIALQEAAHNILYTYVDTIYYHATASDIPLDGYIGNLDREEPFVWWIPVLVTFDVIAFGLLGFYGFIQTRKFLKNYKNK